MLACVTYHPQAYFQLERSNSSDGPSKTCGSEAFLFRSTLCRSASLSRVAPITIRLLSQTQLAKNFSIAHSYTRKISYDGDDYTILYPIILHDVMLTVEALCSIPPRTFTVVSKTTTLGASEGLVALREQVASSIPKTTSLSLRSIRPVNNNKMSYTDCVREQQSLPPSGTILTD
jgi:hypothetical protein